MARALQFSWFKWAKSLRVRGIRIEFRLGRGGEVLLSEPSALATNTARRNRNDEPGRELHEVSRHNPHGPGRTFSHGKRKPFLPVGSAS